VTATAVRHPYINAWSDEHTPHRLAFVWHAGSRSLRLTYTDPVAADWRWGVLWARHGQQMTGTPEFKAINTPRQRRSMLYRLCQVCVPIALQRCPRLRRSHYLYTAAGYEPYAVQADIYEPGPGGLATIVEREVTVTLDRYKALAYALAKQLLVALDGLEPIP
jgi:hypothetical protein